MALMATFMAFKAASIFWMFTFAYLFMAFMAFVAFMAAFFFITFC